jgi:hypothetical protein
MKIFTIQSNEMVKKTYVPNEIRMETHGGDLGHHGLRMEERRQKSSMELPQGKRGGRKERRGERMRRRVGSPFGTPVPSA